MRRLAAIFLSALAFAVSVRAQFFSQGEDPAGLRWYQVETPYYRVIYPTGADSLARVYGALLEKYRVATGRSIGAAPGEFSPGKIPVVLHTRYGYPNASMFWAPKRMDIFTVPDPYGGDPAPWEVTLATHEPRHAAQLQQGYRGGWRFLNYIVGEAWPAAVWALYPNQALGEGDAVALETALVPGARTRTADFLNYFHVAFDQGDWRNWYRWRYGSFKHETPDYYKVGYMTVAGMRHFQKDTLYMKEYFDHILRHPFSIGNMQKTARKATGKSFRDNFNEIMHSFHDMWTAEADARAPFIEARQVTPPSGYASSYTAGAWGDNRLYVLKESKLSGCRLVSVSETGEEQDLGPFSESAGALFFDPATDRLYWSETIPHKRWSLESESRIRYMSVKDLRAKDLTHGGRLYNPYPSSDGSLVAAVEYPWNGGSAIVVASAEDGSIVRRIQAPDSIQITEAAFGDDPGVFCVIGIAANGYGLWRTGPDGGWTEVLPPSVQKLVNIWTEDDYVVFVSDRTGVNELYKYDLSSGKLYQETSFRYGATDFAETPDEFYFSAATSSGIKIFRTGKSCLLHREADYSDVHKYIVEDGLRGQEEALSGDGPIYGETDFSVVSEPRPYHKVPHLVRIHTWAPLYFNYDAVSSMSMDLSYNTASLGITGLFQNTLGTSEGFVGYSAHPDPDSGTPWRHAFHAKWLYSGLYPVIETTVGINDEASVQYGFVSVSGADGEDVGTAASLMTQPLVSGTVSAYIPFNFTSGGHLRGLIPKLSYSLSNNRYRTGKILLDQTATFPGVAVPRQFAGFDGDHSRNVLVRSLSGSLRGYSMLYRGESQVYPSLGIGGEVGFRLRPDLGNIYAPAVYGYLYGYLPGLVPAQGLRLSALGQWEFRQPRSMAESAVSIAPRGFSQSVLNAVVFRSTRQLRLTADYAVPIYIGDISFLSPVAYIKNLLVVPYADLMLSAGDPVNGLGEGPVGTLLSAGADISVELANLLWFPFDCSVGVSLGYLGGPGYKALELSGSRPFTASLIFSMDI